MVSAVCGPSGVAVAEVLRGSVATLIAVIGGALAAVALLALAVGVDGAAVLLVFPIRH